MSQENAEITSGIVEEYFGFKSHWASTRPGERIHYLDEGPKTGDAVILVHGSAIGITAAANFYLTIPVLVEAGYRVIAPDLYGYGWTETPEGVEPWRPNHVDLLLRLMQHLGLEKAWFIGNSLGGMVTADLAINHPERVLGSIIIGTGGARWQHGSRFEPNQTSRGEYVPYSRDLVRRAMEHLVNDPRILTERLIEFRVKMAERPGAYERHLEATRKREEIKKLSPFNYEKAKQCLVPTLFIYGREDRINPPEDALAGAEAFPNADMVLFGHCGHWTMIERADDFHAHMLRFLRGQAQQLAALNPQIKNS